VKKEQPQQWRCKGTENGSATKLVLHSRDSIIELRISKAYFSA
jgi:hypothetical protein